MTLSRVHTWIAGEVLLASDLNAEFNNILNNPGSLFSPTTLTATLTMTGAALNEAQGTNIASAATTDIGAAVGNYVKVTGSTTITAFGTVQAGSRRTVEFTGAPKLTYNATSLILPGAVDYYASAGDVLWFVSEGSGNWRCTDVTPALGVPSAYAGFKNILVNGDMEVWQWGAGGAASIAIAASTTFGTVGSYGPDRWTLGTQANQACTISQQAGLTNGSRWCARVQRNNAQTGIGLQNFDSALDADMVAAIRGVPVTLSAVIRAGANWSPASGTLQMRLSTGTGSTLGVNAGSYTSAADDINTSFTITTSVVRYSGTATLRSTIAQAVVQFSWTPVGTAGAADYFEIDEVQLEIGGAPTVFDRRPFAVELEACQRYYQKSFPYAVAPAQSGGATGGFNVYLGTGVTGTNGGTIPLRPTMRVTPSTVTTYNPSAGNANVRDTTNSADRAITVGTLSDASIPFSFAAGVAASTNVIHWAAFAEIPT